MGSKFSKQEKNSQSINYVDYISPIPEELIESIDSIVEKESMTPKNYVHNKKVSIELYDWLTKEFKKPIGYYYYDRYYYYYYYYYYY